MIKEFKFRGYQNYENYREEIKMLVNEATQDEDMRYYLAINEAVCNAAKYSVSGVLDAEITIKIRLEKSSIHTLVSCQTKPFNARKFREKLRQLAREQTLANMDWGDYTHDAVSGRGFWYMLSACDFIFVEEKGQKVMLHTSLPLCAEHKKHTRIKQLISRFYIEDGGLIV